MTKNPFARRSDSRITRRYTSASVFAQVSCLARLPHRQVSKRWRVGYTTEVRPSYFHREYEKTGSQSWSVYRCDHVASEMH